MKKILIFGAGGSGREIFNLIQEINLYKKDSWKVIGYIDSNKKLLGKKIDGIKVISNSKKFDEKNTYAICGLIDPLKRKRVYQKEIKNRKYSIPNLIHPNIIKPSSLKIGTGNIIFNNVHLSYDVTVSNYNIISNFNDIGHNVRMEDYVTLMPQNIIGGKCKIGKFSFFGSGCRVHQNLKIGSSCNVGMGSTIVQNLKKGSKVITFQRQSISN